MRLEIEGIRRDGGTQPRSKLHRETTELYAERMREGDNFPPVTVFFDGNEYWLADGFHRLEAWIQARPSEPIEAEVIQGTQADAQWYSYGVNKEHGLMRTNEDKARAVKSALCHTEGLKRSDREIAEHVGVSPPTVAKYRAEVEATMKSLQSNTSRNDGSGDPPSSRPRKGRDGRTINTAEIGKGKSKRTKRREVKISPRAIMPKLGHSPPNPMIPLQFSPRNPHTAAATLIREFSREWVEQLIQDLNDFLSQQGAA